MRSGKGIILFRIFLIVLLSLDNFGVIAAQANDTMLVPASTKYSHPSLLNLILLGKNYRKEWRTPVRLPVFNLKAAGLTITELGGGMQTKSLYFKDKHNEEWVLRTVDKDPRGALPSFARNHFTVKVMQQMISAGYPYGAMVVPSLALATGVEVTSPRYYFVPDDAAFGIYRTVFANTICLLERKNVTAADVPVIETEDLVPNLLSNAAYHVDQEKYLKARLLDMLIADWDRHADQWMWAAKKGRFEALPKDRDQAFFYSRGLLLKAARLVAMRHLVGFTASTRCVKKLNFKSWNMDRLFTSELTRADWEEMVQRFCTALTDGAIDSAVKQLPPEIYAISGGTLRNKLVGRRDGMVKDVMRYYSFISREVVINGSDEAEKVNVTGNKDSVTIAISYKGGRMYKRTFYSKETKVVELFLLGGDDRVVCDVKDSRIKIKIDDGAGNDKFDLADRSSVTVVKSEMKAKERERELRKYLKIRG